MVELAAESLHVLAGVRPHNTLRRLLKSMHGPCVEVACVVLDKSHA